MVAIMVAMDAVVELMESHSASDVADFDLLGTTISQPGRTFALCPTLATLPFM